MHETIEAVQLALTVWATAGVGGLAVRRAGRRRPYSARRRRATAPNGSGTPASVRPDRSEADVSDNPAEQRFEIRLHGELVGFSEYRRGDTAVTFHHTEIEPRFRGRGLAGTLIAYALDASRKANLTVDPQCPYVAEFIEKHGEYRDLLTPSSDTTEEPEGCCALPS